VEMMTDSAYTLIADLLKQVGYRFLLDVELLSYLQGEPCCG